MQSVPTLLCVSVFWISANKVGDRMICEYLCTGRKGHASVLDSNSSYLTCNELYMVLLGMVK
jgi:hypothetical protein